MGRLLLYLILGFITLSNLTAQPPTELLNETWYLRFIRSGAEYTYLPYQETSSFVFEETAQGVDITAFGVENTLSGNVTFSSEEDTFQFNNLDYTTNECTSSACSFEEYYFFSFLTDVSNDLKEFEYQFGTRPSGVKYIHLIDENNVRAYFLNYPLGQVDANLIQTWHLKSIGEDIQGALDIENLEPPIFPKLVINEDLSFSGIGSCNNFSGQFAFSDIASEYPAIKYLIATSFLSENYNCDHHPGVENSLFNEFEFGLELIFEVSHNDFWFLSSPAVPFYFGNTPLGIDEDKLNSIKIYPNPVQDKLTILQNNIEITSFSVVSISGQEIITNTPILGYEIDVSSLPSGMYFLKLETPSGTVAKKFIKK